MSNASDYLTSLAAARDAANDAFVAAAVLAQNTAKDTANLQRLLAALDHTKKAYNDALSESLVADSAFVKNEQTQLDATVKKVNQAAAILKDINDVLTLMDQLASLAGSLATAFG